MIGDKAQRVAIEHVKEKATREILKGIKNWRKDKPGIAKRRWVFELIQNAIDTAKARSTKDLMIDLELKESLCIVKHNAGFFNIEEVNAIIYGGSSKPYATDSTYIGRFGSGFLVTHVLSRIIDITGTLSDDTNDLYSFKISLNRSSDITEEVSKSITQTYKQLNDVRLKEEPTNIITEYRYKINDDLGKDAVKIGFRELMRNLPFLFAFNDIHTITINGNEYSSSRENVSGVNVVKIGDKSVVYKGDNSIKVALLLDGKHLINLDEYSRIYVFLPLVGTADYIHIPFVVHSSDFNASEERDSISHDDENKNILNSAFRLLPELITDLTQELGDINCLYELMNFSFVDNERCIQNPIFNFLNEEIKEFLNNIISEFRLVRTQQGMLEFSKILNPINKISHDSELKMDIMHFWKFYELLGQINQSIPLKDEVREWSNIARKLEEMDFEGNLYTFTDFVDEIKSFVKDKGIKYRERSDFEKKYNLENCKQFILEVFWLMNDLYKQKKITADFVDFLLLDQAKYIVAKDWEEGSPMCRGEKVPDALKDIVEEIGYNIREYLIADEFLEMEIIIDFIEEILTSEDIIENVIRDHSFTDRISPEEWEKEVKKINGWIKLFHWALSKKKLCQNFPIISKSKKVMNLKLDQPTIFPPFRMINIKCEFESIFQQKRIIHEKYFSEPFYKRSDFDTDSYSATIITALPLEKSSIELKTHYLKSIEDIPGSSENNDEEHFLTIANNDSLFSSVPFWNEVRETVSRSPLNGQLFIQFLLEHIIRQDKNKFIFQEMICTCSHQKHLIFPLEWLANVKTDYWVPLETKEDNEMKIVPINATKDRITSLFGENLNDIYKTFTNEVRILFPHFGFDRLDLQIILYTITSGIPERDARNKVAQLVDKIEILEEFEDIDPEDLRTIIDKVRQKKKSKQQLEANTIIGENLEYIIRKIITDNDLDVEPIHVGGDMEIWPNADLGWDSGYFKLNRITLEVKFTSGHRVHLTKAQSKNSRDLQSCFSVLVVENVNDLRYKLSILTEEMVDEDMIDLVIENSYIVDNLFEKMGVLPNPDEIEPDINGYWLKKRLWQKNTLDLLNWINKKFS